MQDFGRHSEGVEDPFAGNATLNDLHEIPTIALRADVTGSASGRGSMFGKLREDLAAFRADQVERLSAPVGGRAGRRERQGATLGSPRAGTADRLRWQDGPIALVPLQLLLEVAVAFGIAAGLIMFWSTFGPAIVAALAVQPVQ
ncbi:MAG: hypothetical protein F4Y60_04130 [Boseongicola sp. SB0664_bin_43]|uniref:Uncharacterized protein n=1 Tax=Boseongicola sp. SB0664_bin_43 TaxID=2604844 RepID=A0A6B0XZQ2_9RHOB|nr:hypothetical protein [Boseongicola sp. SB0664_bin_43]MYK32842.1 hypothetical protein [Boseongicola sp. SB0670_bin_30]